MVVGVVRMAVVGALCGDDGNGGDGNRSGIACARAYEVEELVVITSRRRFVAYNPVADKL